ncbi:MAG: MarR family transcriptional regulator [Actinomycetales bacterium]|nr:MarR family transcriptional regulator [Actinomycetales bacterium]
MDADEVDQLVAAWRHERPDLNVKPLQVLSRVTRLAKHLDIARREAFATHDLETGEFDVLAALRRSGQPYALTPSQLVSATLVTSGTMTNRIDRLVTKGFVQRQPDPTDGRGVLVALTETGSTKVDQALKDLLKREQELLKNISTEEFNELVNALRKIVLPLDQHLKPEED